MPGGDNISNLKAMYDRETKYITALGKIREQLLLVKDYKLGHVCPGIQGLIDYIGDVLGE